MELRDELEAKINVIQKYSGRVLNKTRYELVDGEYIEVKATTDTLPLSDKILLMRNETEINRTRKKITKWA